MVASCSGELQNKGMQNVKIVKYKRLRERSHFPVAHQAALHGRDGQELSSLLCWGDLDGSKQCVAMPHSHPLSVVAEGVTSLP